MNETLYVLRDRSSGIWVNDLAFNTRREADLWLDQFGIERIAGTEIVEIDRLTAIAEGFDVGPIDPTSDKFSWQQGDVDIF